MLNPTNCPVRSEQAARLLTKVNEARVSAMAGTLVKHIRDESFDMDVARRNKASSKTHTLALLATANQLKQSDSDRFASFVSSSKIWSELKKVFIVPLEVLSAGFPACEPKRSRKGTNSAEQQAEANALTGLEVRLAVLRALDLAVKNADIATRVNFKIQTLCAALSGLMSLRHQPYK